MSSGQEGKHTEDVVGDEVLWIGQMTSCMQGLLLFFNSCCPFLTSHHSYLMGHGSMSAGTTRQPIMHKEPITTCATVLLSWQEAHITAACLL